MPMLLRRLFGLCFAAVTICECSGYLTFPPQTKIIMSPDASALVRLEPGARPAENMPGRAASATVYHYDRENGNYRKAVKFDLRNREAPDQLLVTNGGRFIIAFDDWEPNIGVGPNVLVVYDSMGVVLKSWSLEDIFSAREIAEFGPIGDIPLRRWRGDNVRISEGRDSDPIVCIPFPKAPHHQLILKLFLNTMTFQRFQRPSEPVLKTNQP